MIGENIRIGPSEMPQKVYRAGCLGVLVHAVHAIERGLLNRADGPHDGLLISCTLPDEIRVERTVPVPHSGGAHLRVVVNLAQTGCRAE